MKHFPFFALYEVFEIQGFTTNSTTQCRLATARRLRGQVWPWLLHWLAQYQRHSDGEAGGRVEMTSAGPSQLPDYI